MTSSSQAGFLAKQGLGYLYSATKASVSALSTGITTAKKSYASYYEKEQLKALQKRGQEPSDLLYLVLQRYYYLSLAGYNNEAAAAAQKSSLKLVDIANSTVPLEVVQCMADIFLDIASRHGDFTKGSWLGLQDFLNSGRMGKDHFDRDGLVSEFYFTTLYLTENLGGLGPGFEQAVRNAAGKLVEGTSYVSDATSYGTGSFSNPSAFSSVSSALPSYATVAPAGAAPPPEQDPKLKAAKVLHVLASSLKKACADAEIKKQKSLKEAQDMVTREQERTSQRML
eukprot:jgi/Mesen1/1716/ME000138S00581